MLILLTSPTYQPINSGLGNAVAQQAACLARSGHEVIVATGGTERKSRIDIDGVRVEYFPINGSNDFLQPIKGDQEAYIDFLRSSTWDVLLFNAWQNWATDLALQHLDQLSGRKFVYSHCISTNIFFFNRPVRSLIRYILWRRYWWRLPQVMQKLDGVFFLANNGSDSRFDDLKIARRHRVPLHIIPNSLSQYALRAMSSPRESFEDRDRIIAVGSYQWQKGFDFVIISYAISNMRNRIPLHLFGQDYFQYKDSLVSLSMKMNIDPNFIFFHEGVSGDLLMEHYRKALIVLSGSRTECQPLVLIDSCALATPYIARSTGCIADMPGGVVANDQMEMARFMNELASNETFWWKLSNSGYAAARDIYHPDILTHNLLKAIAVRINDPKLT